MRIATSYPGAGYRNDYAANFYSFRDFNVPVPDRISISTVDIETTMKPIFIPFDNSRNRNNFLDNNSLRIKNHTSIVTEPEFETKSALALVSPGFLLVRTRDTRTIRNVLRHRGIDCKGSSAMLHERRRVCRTSRRFKEALERRQRGGRKAV